MSERAKEEDEQNINDKAALKYPGSAFRFNDKKYARAKNADQRRRGSRGREEKKKNPTING